MTGPKTRRVRGHGVELELAVWEGKGPPVLCVHGLTANCRSWDTIAEALAPRHKVMAVDLRGRGLSDKPRSGYSVERHCEDLRSLLADLDLPPIAVMGHSLGAVIALAFAAKYPGRVDRMILVDGAGKLTREQTDRVFAGIKPSLDRLGKVFPSFQAYVSAMKQAPFLKPWNLAMETYFRYEVEEVKGGVRSRLNPAHVMEEAANLKKFDAGACYRKVRCPALILRAPRGMLAANDILLPKSAVKKMVAEIPEAWLVEIKDANHYSIMFQPDKTRDRAILNFLEA
jgi:pimeloyl-ACP methyl ester carboxylesterase